MGSLGWIGAERIVGPITSLFASLTMNANSILGRANVAAGAPEQIAVADNSLVGRAGGVVGGIAIAAQSVVMRAAGNVIPQAIAANELVGRAGGNLGPIAVAAQSILMRAAADIVAQAVAANELIGRAGGDLGPLAVAVQSIVMRGAADIVAQAIGTNEIVGRAGGNLGPIGIGVGQVLGRLAADIVPINIANAATPDTIPLRDASGDCLFNSIRSGLDLGSGAGSLGLVGGFFIQRGIAATGGAQTQAHGLGRTPGLYDVVLDGEGAGCLITLVAADATNVSWTTSAAVGTVRVLAM